MKNKSVNTASFYYSLNMLKLLQDMNLVTEDEVAKIKKSLSEHYGVTDISEKFPILSGLVPNFRILLCCRKAKISERSHQR